MRKVYWDGAATAGGAPHAFTAKAPRPGQHRRKALGADLDSLPAKQLAGGCRNRGDRVRALVGVRTEHDH